MSLNTDGAGAEKQSERARLFPGVAGTTRSYSNGGASANASDIERQTSDSAAQHEGGENVEGESDVRKAAVFGALDGLLTSFAVVAGAAGGGLSTQAILIVGISSIVADGLSMGLGEYLSSKAMNEYIDVERRREEWQLANHREGQLENMVELYMRRGMSKEDAQEVSARLSKYEDCFVDAMMAEEIGSYAAPVDEGGSIREGLLTFASFAASGVLPLLVYALSPLFSGSGEEGVSSGALFVWACLVTATALFGIGVVKAAFVSRSWFNSGLETLVLGGCCAGLAYEIGAAVATCVKGMD